jgi:hypothetical protein
MPTGFVCTFMNQDYLDEQFASGDSSGFLILIVDIASEKTGAAARGRADGRRTCRRPDYGSACGPRRPSTQDSLFGIRQSATAFHNQYCRQEEGHGFSHPFSPFICLLGWFWNAVKVYPALLPQAYLPREKPALDKTNYKEGTKLAEIKYVEERQGKLSANGPLSYGKF